MIEEAKGDIFKDEEVNCIVHQANCFHSMKSGIAAIVKEKFPKAYAADLETRKGDIDKLGNFSCARESHNDKMCLIVNLYSQFRYGGKRDTSYDALNDGLIKLRDYLQKFDRSDLIVLGIPANIGCGLGGGSWKIVKVMIYEIFEECKFKVKIVELA